MPSTPPSTTTSTKPSIQFYLALSPVIVEGLTKNFPELGTDPLLVAEKAKPFLKELSVFVEELIKRAVLNDRRVILATVSKQLLTQEPEMPV